MGTVGNQHTSESLQSDLKQTLITMRIFVTTALLVSSITADGPGGHHHGAHHVAHGAPHHAVNLGHHQQVGGVIHVGPWPRSTILSSTQSTTRPPSPIMLPQFITVSTAQSMVTSVWPPTLSPSSLWSPRPPRSLT